MKLVFGRRAQRDHIDDHQYWVATAVYDAEETCIEKWLQDEAFSRQRSVGKTTAVSQVEEITKRIERCYAPQIEVDTSLIRSVHRGEPERDAPSHAVVRTWNGMLAVALLGEATVFLVQGLTQEYFNWVILLWAVILGAGGFILGWGLGDLLLSQWRAQWEGASKRYPWALQAGAGVIGLAIVGFIGWIRSQGLASEASRASVLGVTWGLGLLVALCEGFRRRLGGQRDYLLRAQLNGQLAIASLEHNKKLGAYGKTFEGWVVRFANEGADPLKELPGGQAQQEQAGSGSNANSGALELSDKRSPSGGVKAEREGD